MQAAAVNPTTITQQTGSLMRLLMKVRDVQTKFFISHCDKERKMMFALLKNVDEKLKKFFDENPQELPANFKGTSTRLGYFMRNLVQMRHRENHYLRMRDRKALDEWKPYLHDTERDMQAFFEQHPEELPDNLKRAREIAKDKREWDRFTEMLKGKKYLVINTNPAFTGQAPKEYVHHRIIYRQA